MNDDCLTLVFNQMCLKDVFRLQRVSKQFKECTEESLKQRKRFSVIRLEENLYRYVDYMCPQRHQPLNSYLLNDLSPAFLRLQEIFILSQRKYVLKSITIKCTSIESLALKDCYLNEIVIRIFDENLKHLKCLSLIRCFLSSFKTVVSSPQMKSFSKRVIHLNINRIYDSLNDIGIDDNKLFDFIRLFENISRLSVEFIDSMSIELLFERLAPSLAYIKAEYSSDVDIPHSIPGNIFKNKDLHLLQSLQMYENPISKQTFQTIITYLSLKTFDFECHELTSTLMVEMAHKQKDLKKLGLCYCHFIEYNDFERDVVFQKVESFCLNDPKMNLIYFKQIVNMFPNTKKLVYLPWDGINCQINVVNVKCKSCYYRTYDLIPRLDSVKCFYTYFRLISSSFFQCLDGFPNLIYLKVGCFHPSPLDPPHPNGYDFKTGQLKDTMDYLFRICEEKPRKMIKFKLFCDQIPLPSDLQRPRNLKILKSNEH